MNERVSRAVGLGNLGSAARSCANVFGSPEPSRSSPMTTSQVRTHCCRSNAMSRGSAFRRCCIQAFVSTRITVLPRRAFGRARARCFAAELHQSLARLPREKSSQTFLDERGLRHAWMRLDDLI